MSVARKYQRRTHRSRFIASLLAATVGLVMVGAGLQPDTKPKPLPPSPAPPVPVTPTPSAPAHPDLKPDSQPTKPEVKPEDPAVKDELPTVEQIMDKNIEATGGKDNWAKVKTQFTQSTMSSPAIGLKCSINAWRGENGKTLVEMDVNDKGAIRQGSDGETVWIIDPAQGPRILSGDDSEVQLSVAKLDNPLDWKKLYKKTEVAGTVKIAGKTAYKVVCTLQVGDQTVTQFFDKESGLLIKTSTVTKSAIVEFPSDSFPSDYKEVSGVKLAHKYVRKMMMVEVIETIEKIEINPEIPKDKFELPREIKELKEAAGKPAARKPDKAPTPPTTPTTPAKPEKK